MFGRGETPDIKITVAGDGRPFVPGDTVRANVTFSGGKGFKARSVVAGLAFVRTSREMLKTRDADGDRNVSVRSVTHENWVHSSPVDADTSNGPHSLDFEWALPADAPPTYSGEITSNRWMVKVTIDRKLARDTNEVAEITVLAPLPAADEPLTCQEAHSDATLSIELPRRSYAEGETITGRLAFEPRGDIKARALRIELVRSERVDSKDGKNEREHIAEKTELAREGNLGQPAEFPFSFALPAATQPSHRAGGAMASWAVRAVIDRPMRGDITAVAAITACSAGAAVKAGS